MNFILSWLAKRFGMAALGASGWWFMAIVAAGIAAGSAWGGYWLADTIWEAKHANALEEAMEQRLELELDLAERDQQLVETENEIDTEYKTVYRTPPGYITPDQCDLTPAGLQELVDQVRSANRRGGYDAAVRPSP